MSKNKKRKKKVYPGTASAAAAAAAKDPSMLQDDSQARKLDPLARKLVIGAVILVALAQMLDTVLQLVPRGVGDAMTIVGILMLVAAFVAQSRSAVSYRDRSGKTKGPRL